MGSQEPVEPVLKEPLYYLGSGEPLVPTYLSAMAPETIVVAVVANDNWKRKVV